MTDERLKDLAHEIEDSLRSPAVPERDRALLEDVHAELKTALSSLPQSVQTGSLRSKLRVAIERLEGEHPHLTSLLSKALDALSDIGV
jgi:hypothetical protein